MESQKGTTLAEVMRRRGRNAFPAFEALIYLKAISTSLAQIHGRGLVHGDVKPASVVIDEQGRIALGSVGFAQQIGVQSVVRAPVQVVPHLAPELVSGQVVDESADVYSLGVLLYELLTGEAPAPGSGKTVRSLRQVNPSINQDLSQVIMRSLASDPGERFPTPGALLEAACSALNLSPGQIPELLELATSADAPATMVIPSSPAVPETMVISSSPAVPETMAVPGSPQAVSIETGEPGREPLSLFGRPLWFWAAIGLGVFILIVCVGLLVGTQLPELITSLSSTSTPTSTSTPLASETPISSPTPLATDTPVPATPTDTSIPPTLPPPTEAPTIVPEATHTSVSTTGNLQVRNRFPYPIYVFRDLRSLTTSPIPPGMYLIFFNQPAGTHTYRFCQNPNMTQCLEKEITITGDLEITVP